MKKRTVFFRVALVWFWGLRDFTFTLLFAYSVSPDGSLQFDIPIDFFLRRQK